MNLRYLLTGDFDKPQAYFLEATARTKALRLASSTGKAVTMEKQTLVDGTWRTLETTNIAGILDDVFVDDGVGG